MAKINAIGNATGSLTVDPGASGDSAVQFSINATPEFIIGVDDTDDSFRISVGSALGTTDALEISADGFVNMDGQPCFLAKTGADKSNVTGDGTVYSVIYDTVIFDNNSDFNAGSGVFIAPVTGKFYLIAKVTMNAPAGGGDTMEVKIVTSNRTYTGSAGPLENQVTGYGGGNDWTAHSFGCLCDLDATDTAYVTVTDAGSAKTDDVEGGGEVRSGFYGALIC